VTPDQGTFNFSGSPGILFVEINQLLLISAMAGSSAAIFRAPPLVAGK